MPPLKAATSSRRRCRTSARRGRGPNGSCRTRSRRSAICKPSLDMRSWRIGRHLMPPDRRAMLPRLCRRSTGSAKPAGARTSRLGAQWLRLRCTKRFLPAPVRNGACRRRPPPGRIQTHKRPWQSPRPRFLPRERALVHSVDGGRDGPSPGPLCDDALATDGFRASCQQHPVQDGHADGSLGLLGSEAAGSQPWSNQRFVAAHCRFH